MSSNLWSQVDANVLIKPVQAVNNTQTTDFYPIWHNNELWYLSNSSRTEAVPERVYSIWKFGKTQKKILLDLQALDGFSNVGSIAFVPETDVVYITLAVHGVFRIYSGTLQNDIIRGLSPLPFNSDNYNVMQPTVSPDGRSIIFASDMGNYGKTDLFQVFKQEDGNWSVPFNLGSAINSPLNDAFPHWDPTSGLLFFSSQGHQSKGGYDIFVSRQSRDGWSKAVAIASLNTVFDDLGLCLQSDNTGYFSSNRTGSDDLFHFQVVQGSLIPSKAAQTIQVVMDFYDPALQKPVECQHIVSKVDHFKVLRSLNAHQVLVEVVPDLPVTLVLKTKQGQSMEIRHTFFPVNDQQKVMIPLNEQVLYRLKGTVLDKSAMQPIAHLKMIIKDDCSKDSIVMFSGESGMFNVAFSSPCKESIVQFPDTDIKPALLPLNPAKPFIHRDFQLNRATFKPIEIRKNGVLLTSDNHSNEPEIEQLIKLLQKHHTLQVDLQTYYLKNGDFEESCVEDYKNLRKLKSFLNLKGVSSARLTIPCEEMEYTLPIKKSYDKKGYKITIHNPGPPFNLNPLDWDFKIIPGQ